MMVQSFHVFIDIDLINWYVDIVFKVAITFQNLVLVF